MLRGSGKSAVLGKDDKGEDPVELGAKALKDAMASGDSKKIVAAFKAMQVMCTDSDDE